MSLIVYGDIHGCYDEFVSLRKKIKPKKDDIEVCVGDVITKGRNSIKVLDFLIKNNITSVLGNHEDKLLRYLTHQDSGKKNPIILDDDEQNIIYNLTAEHIEYLQKMPLFFKYKNILVLHAGVLNHFNIENLSKREEQQLLRLRYVDTNGNFIAYGKEDKSSKFWSEVYDERFGFVVYGHQWFQYAKIDKHSVGIDTGCVYENKLSAIVFDIDKTDKYQIITTSCNK